MKPIFAILLLTLSLGACAHRTIEGTKVKDTDEHRVLYDIVMEYRDAFQARDANRVIALLSPEYFEDNGNADPSDDYGYVQLRDEILPRTFGATEEMYLTLKVQDIVVTDERFAHVDVRYDSRARISMPSGDSWNSQREFNRIEFTREDDRWLIIRGL